jgi:hypothetical protein
MIAQISSSLKIKHSKKTHTFRYVPLNKKTVLHQISNNRIIFLKCSKSICPDAVLAMTVMVNKVGPVLGWTGLDVHMRKAQDNGI